MRDEDEDIIEHGHTPLYNNNDRHEDVFDDTSNEDNDRPYGYDNNPVLEVDGGNGEHSLEVDDHGFEDDELNHNNLDPMNIEENNGHLNSPQAGQKCPHHDSDPDQPSIDEFWKAIKLKKSKGKLKADERKGDNNSEVLRYKM